MPPPPPFHPTPPKQINHWLLCPGQYMFSTQKQLQAKGLKSHSTLALKFRSFSTTHVHNLLQQTECPWKWWSGVRQAFIFQRARTGISGLTSFGLYQPQELSYQILPADAYTSHKSITTKSYLIMSIPATKAELPSPISSCLLCQP